jgi:uncharacterized membrane protein
VYPLVVPYYYNNKNGKTYHLFIHSQVVHMKDGKVVKRSSMKVEDLGLKIIDDRPWLLKKACHGDPTRAFWLGGKPFPLCSRCITFYPFMFIGILIGPVVFSLIEVLSWQMLLAFALLEAPLILDGWSQYIGWRSSNNTLRAITGALAGIGIGAGIVYMLFWMLL